MRRIRRVVLLASLLHVLAATPALAWWDWLDDWSGPKGWKGPVFGARLVCFVADKNQYRLAGSPAPADRSAEKARRGAAPRALPIGFLYSACDLDEKNEWRRGSIEVGMRFLWTYDERFAQGRRMNFTTIEPVFTWSIFNDPNRNIVDYGMGAGFYWVASEAFPTVSGGFLEPIRFDFHLPSNQDDTEWKRWLRVSIVRYGWIVFPGGFEPGAFAPNPGVAHRIARDWNCYYGIYTDWDALVAAIKR